MPTLRICLLFALIGSAAAPVAAAAVPEAAVASAVERYAALVHRRYAEAHGGVRAMQLAVAQFLAEPNDATLELARQAWRHAHNLYSLTEAYRYYEGPIDAPPGSGGGVIEGRLNAWPLNEAYIDYVAGNPGAGIVQDPSIPLDRGVLINKNAADDEADVTTGFHAVEFLLWGQDARLDGPGNRPVSDYVGDGVAVQRRRQYLKLATDLIVDDLATLEQAWAPAPAPGKSGNYAASFRSGGKQSLGKALTGIATLAGFELASERIAVALQSGDQEDEQSCFSDNTLEDLRYNIEGIAQVHEALQTAIREGAPKAHRELAASIERAQRIAASLHGPMDVILADPRHAERPRLAELVKALQAIATQLQAAGREMGIDVVIAGQ